MNPTIFLFLLCLYTTPHFRVLIFFYTLLKEGFIQDDFFCIFHDWATKNIQLTNMIQSQIYNWTRQCTLNFETWLQVFNWVRIFKFLSLKFFALLRVWLYNGHCFKVKCVKYCWISDLWPFCLSHWSYTSTPMLISFMYTEYFYYFLLLKLQYEILVGWRKVVGVTGCRPSVCEGKPLFSRSRSDVDRWPNKTWETAVFAVW